MVDKPDTRVSPPVNETAVAIQALAEQLLARQPEDPNNMGLTEAKRRELTAPLTPQKFRLVKCVDEDRGVRFTATVVESRAHVHGRITAIGFFVWPDGIYTSVSRGGVVPDGMPIFSDPSVIYVPGMAVVSTTLSKLYKEWRLEEFITPLFRRYPGKELREELCDPKGEGLKTTWQMSATDLQESATAHA